MFYTRWCHNSFLLFFAGMLNNDKRPLAGGSMCYGFSNQVYCQSVVKSILEPLSTSALCVSVQERLLVSFLWKWYLREAFEIQTSLCTEKKKRFECTVKTKRDNNTTSPHKCRIGWDEGKVKAASLLWSLWLEVFYFEAKFSFELLKWKSITWPKRWWMHSLTFQPL